MNIGSMHSDEDDLYLPIWPTSSTTLAVDHSFTSQSGNSGTIGLFNELITTDSSFQTLDVPSRPMHSEHYNTVEDHVEDFNFLKNVSELDPQLLMPELADEHPPLWSEVPPALCQYYVKEMPNKNPQEIGLHSSFSTYTFPEGNFEGWMDTEGNINGVANNLINIAHEGNISRFMLSGTHNGISGSENHVGNNQTDKTSQLPDNIHVDRRRGFRSKPKRSLNSERGSIYRGVSRYSGCFEAFLWDNTNRGEKPKTVYIGGFDDEKEAARAYDLAAIKLWGKAAPTNFPLTNYKKEMEEMQYMTKKDYLLSIRRKSRGFSKGISSYRGVSRNSDYKKWQARLGKGRGMRSIYIGTFDTEEEAARAYDVAAIRMKGFKAITNFEISNYDVSSILACKKLPIGKGASKVLKKTSIDDFLLTKRNTKKAPALCLDSENLSSSQPHTQQQSFREQFTTLAMAPSNQMSPYFQQNFNNANQIFNRNLCSSSFQLYGIQDLTQNGGRETSDGNLTSSNLAFPYNGVYGEQNLTMTENNELMANNGILPGWNQPIQPSNHHSHIHQSYKHTSQLLQPQIPRFPFLGYENLDFLTNPDFLHESINAGSGLERNEIYMGGNLNRGFSEENSLLDGDSIVTNTGDYSLGISWGGIQQVEELDQTFQTLQQNQIFEQFHHYAGNDISDLLEDQNADPCHSRETQNLESQTNPNNFLYGCLTGVLDQMNVRTNVNFSSCVQGLADNSGFLEENLMVMQTTEKMNFNADASNGGFRIHETPIFMEENSGPQSLVEKGDQLISEDFGQDMGDFGIDSFKLDESTILDELISSF